MNSCYVLCYRPILLKPTAYWNHLRNSKILIPGLFPRYSDLLGLRHSFCLSICCFMLSWWFYCKARHGNNFSRAIKLSKARFLCLRNSKKKNVLSDRCGKMTCWCSIIELCSRRTWSGSSENLIKKVELELISNKSKDFLPAQSKEEPLGKGKNGQRHNSWSHQMYLKNISNKMFTRRVWGGEYGGEEVEGRGKNQIRKGLTPVWILSTENKLKEFLGNWIISS